MPSRDPYGRDPRFKDFRAILYVIWKHLGIAAPTPLQRQVASIIQNGPEKLFIAGFRGMGKSYILAAYCIFLWYWRPNTRILVTSASGNKAEEFATMVLNLIEEMDEFEFLRPRQNQRSSVLKFDVGPAKIAQSPSMRAVGITGQTAGGRADVIICDDVEIPENSATETQREAVQRSALDLPKMLIPEGLNRQIYLGTYQTENSIYLILPERGFHPYIIPARYPKTEKLQSYVTSVREVVKDDAGTPSIIEKSVNALAPFVLAWKEQGKVDEWEPLEPDRFDDFTLMKHENDGRSSFMLQYMLDKDLSNEDRYPLKLRDLIVMDTGPERAPERPVWGRTDSNELRDLDNVGLTGDRFYGPLELQGNWVPYTSKIMAVDPAGRGKDEAAFCVLGELNGYLYVLAWGGVNNVFDEENLDHLVKVAVDHKVEKIVYEKNMGDEMFQKILQPRLIRAGRGVTFVPVHNSKAKEPRICDVLEPILNSHRLIVDRKVVEKDLKQLRRGVDDADARVCRGLYQLTHISRDRGCLKFDDRIDVLALGASEFQARMALDADRQMERRHLEMLQEELRKEISWGSPKASNPTWANNIRLQAAARRWR